MTRLDYWKRRCHTAEMLLKFEEKHNEHTTQWAIKAFDEQRRLIDRIIHVYEIAVRHGATTEELSSSDTPTALDDPV